jgi:hypothetical protein
MNRRLTLGSAVIVCVLMIAVGWLYRRVRDTEYEFISRHLSPNGELGIFAFRSATEGGHAPYGDHLTLSPGESLRRPSDGYVVFAGYCSKELSVFWRSDSEVLIRCVTTEPNPVRTLANKALGVDVRLDIVQSAP